jgi:hypothetical protein
MKKMKIITLPEYDDDEIKKIEEEFDTEEGWVKGDEVFGEDRDVESYFISIPLKKHKK